MKTILLFVTLTVVMVIGFNFAIRNSEAKCGACRNPVVTGTFAQVTIHSGSQTRSRAAATAYDRRRVVSLGANLMTLCSDQWGATDFWNISDPGEGRAWRELIELESPCHCTTNPTNRTHRVLEIR